MILAAYLVAIVVTADGGERKEYKITSWDGADAMRQCQDYKPVYEAEVRRHIARPVNLTFQCKRGTYTANP